MTSTRMHAEFARKVRNTLAKVARLEAELVEVRSQLDRIRAAAGEVDLKFQDDEDFDRQYELERLLDVILGTVEQPVSPEELAKISPALSDILKEGRVS